MRILHITDLHILADPGAHMLGVDTFVTLKSVLAELRSITPMPNMIIATGDLSEDGTVKSYKRLRTLLVDLDLPVFVLPGNHDDVDHIQEGLTGGPIKMEFLHHVGGWGFVFLNSQIVGQSNGRVSDSEMKKLKAVLNENPDRPFLISVHHTSVRPCPDEDCHLLNTGDLLSIVERHPNARAVIGGHTHTEAIVDHKHLRLMTTPSTCIQCVHPTAEEFHSSKDRSKLHKWDSSFLGFRFLDIMPDGQIETVVHKIVSPETARPPGR